MDNLKIDSHKLIYHPDIVSRWYEGENIYPIEIEVGLTNACNHRCIFCAVDYTGYHPVMMDTSIYLKNMEEISQMGVKSIIYAGEGEPLIHKDAPYIINHTKSLGIDTALSTNGVLLTPEMSRDILKSLTWVRFSVAGIREDTYNQIQRGRPNDLETVLYHMQEVVKIKKDQRLKITLGVQLLLLPQNMDEILKMGEELSKIGVDYFTIKPFSQHPKSNQIMQIDYNEMLELEKSIKGLETEKFKIYFRAHAMEKLRYKRSYEQCLALPFMTYLDAKGNLWPCIAFMGNEKFSYGNIYEQTFKEIWEGLGRAEINKEFSKMDLEKNCREICRLDEMNKYLNELKHPGEHVNFI